MLAPSDERIKKISEAYYEWHRRECARPGATVSTETPQEVDTAIAKQTAAKKTAAARFYRAHEQDVRAELEAMFADADAKFLAAAEAMQSLADTERSVRRFQAACGQPISPYSIAYSALDMGAWRGWHAHAERVLNAPAPAIVPAKPAAANPLELPPFVAVVAAQASE